MQNKIQIFEKQPIRAVWDEENETVTVCHGLKRLAPDRKKTCYALKTNKI